LVIRFVFQEDFTMYSLVVLMALTTTTEAPDGRGCGGGHSRGGSSCCGSSCYSGCYSSCYSSCYSYGVYAGCASSVYGAPDIGVPARSRTGKTGSEDETSTSATIVVNLPAEATLTIDGAATRSTSDKRVFTSPELTPGKKYYYQFKAEVIRDGKTVLVEQKVPVIAGQTKEISLTMPAEGIASR
jgi:uncharacterized protein (TIGR03000 family)